MQLIERAYNEWARLPMPTLDQNHIFDRSKYQLEDEAIKTEIKWVAKKYGLEFRDLDMFIQNKTEV